MWPQQSDQRDRKDGLPGVAMTTSIQIEGDSLSVRAGGPATGETGMVFDGHEYQRGTWLERLLLWWSWQPGRSLLCGSRRGVSEREIVQLIEGPYSVEVTTAFATRGASFSCA